MDALLSAYGSDSEQEAPQVLPQPSRGAGAAPGKRVVQFHVPIRTDALTKDEEEELRPRKRAATAAASAGSGGLSGLSALLPKPLHEDLGGSANGGGGTKLDLGGGGRSEAPAAREAFPCEQPPRAAPASLGPSSASFRLDAAPEQPDAQAPHPSLMFRVHPGCCATPAELSGWVVPHDPASAPASASAPDQLLFRALEEERCARGGRFETPAVREVSAAELTAGREQAERATQNLAFGPEHEAKLRTEAGNKPSDVARRKHQIGSLLHDAKVQELKLMEGRAQGLKSKSQTRAKYGW